MLGVRRILSLLLVSLLPGAARSSPVSPQAPRAGRGCIAREHAGEGLGCGCGQEGSCGAVVLRSRGAFRWPAACGAQAAAWPSRRGRAGRSARPSRSPVACVFCSGRRFRWDPGPQRCREVGERRCAHTLAASQFSRRRKGGGLSVARVRGGSPGLWFGAPSLAQCVLCGALRKEKMGSGDLPASPLQWELWLHCFRDVFLPNISCPSRRLLFLTWIFQAFRVWRTGGGGRGAGGSRRSRWREAWGASR